MSVDAPIVVPWTITPTPMSGTFSLSVTVPLTDMGFDWAKAELLLENPPPEG